jgi:predicted O-methyltransferase YrrM
MAEFPNWFESDGLGNFDFFLKPLADLPTKALQVGAYTGDASMWLFENILKHPDSVLVDVDTWEGSDEPSHHQMNWSSVESVYDQKTFYAREQRKIIKRKSTSSQFFRNNMEQYNFIYVDGDHTAQGVLQDAVDSYRALAVGGIIAFDDYQWSAGLGEVNEPKLGVDAFWSVYKEQLEVLLVGYQCWFKKVRD